MNVREQVRCDETPTGEFPTLCSVPLRAEWFDEPEMAGPVVVRGTD